jgi:hypothetical protein
VGFVGLGNMGAHMASNLLKAGHHLTVHDKYNFIISHSPVPSTCHSLPHVGFLLLIVSIVHGRSLLKANVINCICC